MMDLKEIIKWFIPCFHILRVNKVKLDVRLTCICLFLLFNFRFGMTAKIDSLDINILNTTKNVGLSRIFNAIDSDTSAFSTTIMEKERSVDDYSVARTFGRPFKKMAQVLIPLVFQIGAASTWAVIAAIVGVKTLFVALIILKLLLVAGAAKIGALFGSKEHHQPAGWESPSHQPYQKEIHLHIHNNGLHEAHSDHSAPTVWSRDGAPIPAQENTHGNLNVVFDPYASGPQTISTPYGNYVKVEQPNTHTTAYY